MADFFAVVGGNSQQVEATLRRARTLFARLHGVTASAEHVGERLGLLTFSKPYCPASGISKHPKDHVMACGAGAWLRDTQGAESALAHVVSAFAEGNASGLRVAREFDGSFAFLVAGPEDGVVRIVTDRVGTLHVYTTKMAERSLVSTSSLLLAALIDPTYDPVSVAEFLTMGTVFDQRTLFNGIEKLAPSSVHRISDRVESVPTWRFEEVAWSLGATRGSVPALGEALVSVVRRIAAAHPRSLFDLTGGYDSRAVIAAARRAGIECETVVNGPVDHPDVVAANRIAERFGLDHRHQTLAKDWIRNRWWAQARVALSLCDGEYDMLEYARVLEHHQRVAREDGASVNGSGGEFCKGYWWELLFPHTGSSRPLDARRVATARFVTDPWADGMVRGVPPGELKEHFASVVSRASSGLGRLPNTALMDHVYLRLRMQRWQGRIASATLRLWPVYSPFMFREPMELAFGAHPSIRMRNRMSIAVIEHLDPHLARLPLAQGYPAQRLRVSNAHRFLPLASEIGGKVLRRIGRRIGPAPPTEGPTRPIECLIESTPKVRLLLDPREMLTADLFEPSKLTEITEVVPQNVSEAHVGRLLTLECGARALRDARKWLEVTNS